MIEPEHKITIWDYDPSDFSHVVIVPCIKAFSIFTCNTMSDSNIPDTSLFDTYFKCKQQSHEQEFDLFLEFMTAFRREKEAEALFNLICNRYGSLKVAIENDFKGFKDTDNQSLTSLIQLLTSLTKRIKTTDVVLSKTTFNQLDDCIEHIVTALGNETSEVFYALYLNNNYKVLHTMRFTGVSQVHVNVDIRLLLMNRPTASSCSLIVAHNHNISGSKPSHSDIEFTRTLADVCRKTNMTLIDHIIAYRDTCFGILSEKQYKIQTR